MALDDIEWATEVVTDDKLNILSFFSFTNLAAFPSSNFGVGNKGIAEDTGVVYQNTGTFGTPVWTALTTAASEVVEILDNHEASGAEASYTFTPSSALTTDDYSEIIVLMDFEATATFALEMILNGVTSNYFSKGFRADGVALTNIAHNNQTEIQICSTTAATTNVPMFSKISIGMIDTDAGDLAGFSTTGQGTGALYENMFFSKQAVTAEITSIKMQTSTSTWKIGSKITTYGRKRT